MEKQSIDLKETINKENIHDFKGLVPENILADMEQKLKNMDTAVPLAGNQEGMKKLFANDVKSSSEPIDEAEERRKMLRAKLRGKTNNMSNGRKGKDFLMKQQIDMLQKHTANMENHSNIADLMMSSMQNMIHTSKQKKMAKKNIDKIVSKLEKNDD